MRINNGEPFDLSNATRTEYGRKRVYGGGGSSGQTSTTSNSVPEELKPLASLYTQQATDIASTPYQKYTDQRYAGLNQNQNAGIDMVANRALNGSQTMNNAEGSLNSFITGGNTNPYLDSLVSKAQSSVVNQFNETTKPQLEASMQNSGSFGNSGYSQLMQSKQKAAGQQMSDIANQMYGQAYEGDQAKRMQAIGMAPTFGNAAYQDAGQLLNAGGLQQQTDQNNLDFNYQQFQNAADNPYKQLQATGGVLQGNMGSNTTQSGGGK